MGESQTDAAAGNGPRVVVNLAVAHPARCLEWECWNDIDFVSWFISATGSESETADSTDDSSRRQRSSSGRCRCGKIRAGLSESQSPSSGHESRPPRTAPRSGNARSTRGHRLKSCCGGEFITGMRSVVVNNRRMPYWRRLSKDTPYPSNEASWTRRSKKGR